MSTWLPFLVTGIAAGAVYGMTATGLVLTYKISGVFNLAHGAVAALAAYGFYELREVHGWPWPLALAVWVVGGGPVLGLVLHVITRRLSGASTAAKLTATVGLLLAIQGAIVAVKGAASIAFRPFLPTDTFRVAGVNVGYDQAIIAAGAAAATVLLNLFFRRSRLGIAMRAVVDNPDLLGLSAGAPDRVRYLAWVLGSAFAALSGILLANLTLGLDPVVLTLVAVQAYGAAAVGRFTNLPLTFAGGILIGVGADLLKRLAADVPALAGLPSSLPFIVLFVVLLVTPKGKLTEAGAVRTQRSGLADAIALPTPWVWAGRGAMAIGLLVVPLLVGPRLPVYSNAVIFVLVFASLRLLVRTSGQISLCQAGFAAVGAAAFSHLTSGASVPWVPALLLAGLTAVPVGALVAIPAIRLSGLYLALATFGFGILLERMAYTTFLMFGLSGDRPAPRPGGFGGDRAFYYVCLLVVGLALLAVQALRRARLGQLLRAMSDSALVLSTNGANVNITRVLAFCFSAFLAALAGALFAAQAGAINGLPFTALNSLLWLAILVISGSGEISSVVAAAGLLVVVPAYANSPGYIEAQPVMFGVLAVAAALRSAGSLRLPPRLIAAARERAGQSLAGTRDRRAVPALPAAAEGSVR